MFKHLLVPIDGTELSFSALKSAAAFANEIDAKLTILTVVPSYPLGYFTAGAGTDPARSTVFAELASGKANQILSSALRLVEDGKIEVSTMLVDGDVPYKAIVETADAISADLIFMASHGRQAIASLLLGSETQKVLSHTKIPVLVHR